MVYVGLFVAGMSFAALAALYTPKRVIKWGDKNAPHVTTIIQIKKEK